MYIKYECEKRTSTHCTHTYAHIYNTTHTAQVSSIVHHNMYDTNIITGVFDCEMMCVHQSFDTTDQQTDRLGGRR